MKVFAEEDITFYGGGRTRAGGWEDWPEDEYPDLAVGPTAELDVETRVPHGWGCETHLPTFIELEWPDMRAPLVPPSFWASLVDDIRAKDEIRVVQAQCMGGHGRTGTALSIFLALMRPELYDSVDMLVKDLRMLYCENAVETNGQFRYIAKATGLPYHGRVTSSKKWSSGGYGGSYGSYASSTQQLPLQPTGADAEAFAEEAEEPAEDDLEELNNWFGAKDVEKLATTGEQDLEILVEAHASDLGLSFEEIEENGFHWYALVDEETGAVEEFDSLSQAADFLQLDAIYSY